MFDGETGAGGGTVTTPTPAATPATPWYQGADPELIGHIQTKGWHEKPANEAALEAVKAHREAERHIGVPADQIIRAPKDANDEAGWKALYARLGVPETADKYDFSTVKRADGTPLDDSLTAFLRQTASDLKLPADRAPALANELTKYLDGQKAAAATEIDAKVIEERAALQKNWGANFEANKFLAQRGAIALGVDPEVVMALEKQVGYAKTMEAFRRVGELNGEGRFIANGNPNFNSGVRTVEQAVARKAELMADSAWVGRYNAGGAPEAREMKALLTIITGESDADYTR
jgi:hypothetical protein